MAGTAGAAARRAWRVGRLVETTDETSTARTLVLDVPGWPGHLAGQRVDVRLTAADGYQTSRAYSLAAPADGDRIAITVQQVRDGEVSPYLTGVYSVGDPVEVRGPVGGWFVWSPDGPPDPVLLVAGGSGVVPLMAMIRARRAAGSRVPFRLVYSLRGPEELLYAAELRRRGPGDGGLDVAYVYTRRVPESWPAPPQRITAVDLAAHGWPAELDPVCYVCGPSGFVTAVADLLVTAGHDPARIRTERFGPTGR